MTSLDVTRPQLKSSPFQCSVVCARFHPLSDNFIVVLTPSSLFTLQLRVVKGGSEERLDLVSIETLLLPPLSSSVCSFCFGSHKSWSVFSLFFLCSDGTLYSIDSWLPPSFPVPVALIDDLRTEAMSRHADNYTEDLLSWITQNFTVCEYDTSYCLYSSKSGNSRELGRGRGHVYSGSSLSHLYNEYLPFFSGPLNVQGPDYKDTRNREFCDVAVTSFEIALCIVLVTRSNRVISLASLSSTVPLPIFDKQRSKQQEGHHHHHYHPKVSSMLQCHPSSAADFVVVSAIEMKSSNDDERIESSRSVSDLKSSSSSSSSSFFLQHCKAPSIIILVSSPNVFSLDLVFLKSINEFIYSNKEEGGQKEKLVSNKSKNDENLKFSVEVNANLFDNKTSNLSNQALIVSSTVFSAVLVEFVTTEKDEEIVYIRSGFSGQDLLEDLRHGLKVKEGDKGTEAAIFDPEAEKLRILKAFNKRRGILSFNNTSTLPSATEDEVALAMFEEAAVIRAAQATHFSVAPTMESFSNTAEEMAALTVRIESSKEKARAIEARLVQSLSAQLCQLKDVEAALYAWRLRKMETNGK